jgi:hypothetical protein
LSEAVVRRILERALDVAAFTCQRAGANPPTRAEYETFAFGRHDQITQPAVEADSNGGDR